MEDNSGVTEDSDSGKGLRAQLEKALADKKELETKLSELQGKQRQAEVSQVLASKGVNAKIAKFIPDSVTGEEGINAWLTENADVFGFQVGEGTEPAGETVDAETVSASKRMQSVGQAASSPGKLADIEARIRNAETDAEVDALWKEAQSFML